LRLIQTGQQPVHLIVPRMSRGRDFLVTRWTLAPMHFRTRHGALQGISGWATLDILSRTLWPLIARSFENRKLIFYNS
jgi:hypothetical protein